MEEFIDRFHNHRRLITVLAVFVIITTAVFSKMNIAITVTMCSFVIAFQLIYEIIRKYVDEQRSSIFGFFIFLEIVISNMIETYMLDNLYCFIVFILNIVLLVFLHKKV